MFLIKIANIVIGIDNKYDYVKNISNDYIVDNLSPDFVIRTSMEEDDAEKIPRVYFFEGYCESIALYRKIANKLLDYNAFLMHAAVLAIDQEAYVFMAPSGTGKTTHIDLWSKVYGESVEIINGDKPIMRFMDDKLYACGSPWNGKENKGNNLMYPVKAFCFLEQNKVNTIRQLDEEVVIGKLFHQVLMPEDEAQTILFFDMMNRLISDHRFYLLQCNMDPEAATIAYETMRN